VTDWIEHTGDTCPVDPETVVEYRLGNGKSCGERKARLLRWDSKGCDWSITHYRIVTPAKPPEPEMTKTHEDYAGPTFGVPTKPEPDFVALRLECLKLAVTADPQGLWDDGVVGLADYFLRYAIDGSVDKADA
jgi:hypothetical protein